MGICQGHHHLPLALTSALVLTHTVIVSTSSQQSVQERAQGRKEGKTGSSCVSGGARSQYTNMR
ncbi:hypothetical protein U0070_000850 [Myodes glareolus]|uniref:Secreted protein n=1 Tax=Myodes glareolus TaxID=447135 RepID=A0AAW0HA57_MYOGA